MKKILLVMFILLFTAASVFCGEFENALERAEQGNADAQFYLGAMYYNSRGVPQDYKQAAFWFTKAAEQGHGVPLDYKQVVRWYTKSAEQGNILAQISLGLMYYHGQGVPLDYKQAMGWWKKAAEQGNAEAQYNLGLMCEKGLGVAQDYQQAVHWYSRAAEQGGADVQFKLGAMYAFGKGIVQDYKQAVHWWTKAAEQGSAEAQFSLGGMYALGKGVTQNYKLAFVWVSLAADQRFESAIKHRDITAKKLTPKQLSEAQDLAAQIQYKIDNPTKSPRHRGPASTSAADLRWVQHTLKNLGYDPGPIDGVTGAQTRGAIITFQTDHGVAPTGTIDEILFLQLRQMTKSNQESPPAKTETGKIIVSGTIAGETPDTPSDRQAASERYLAVVSVENMMKDIAEKTSENLPAEQREIYVDIMTNYIRISVLERAVIASLVNHFTVRELDALTDFYESPEGRSAMKKIGAYMADVMPVIQQEMARAIEQHKDDF